MACFGFWVSRTHPPAPFSWEEKGVLGAIPNSNFSINIQPTPLCLESEECFQGDFDLKLSNFHPSHSPLFLKEGPGVS